MEEPRTFDPSNAEQEEPVLSDQAALLRTRLHNVMVGALAQEGLVLQEDKLDELLLTLGVTNQTLEGVVKRIDSYRDMPDAQK